MGCTTSNTQNQAQNPTPTVPAKPQSTATPNSSTHKPATPAAPANQAKPQKTLPHTIAARYKLGEIIGEGGYAVVKSAISIVDHSKVAVKIVNRTKLSADDEASLRTEVKILSELNHPNVVRSFDFFEEEKHFYVVLEYLDGGELFDRIVQKTYYNEKEARDLVLILLRALKYLHDRDIVHRDLKPENLLMQSKSDDANVKIADFGFAAKVKGLTLSTKCGTPGYIAPEILLDQSYGKPVDLWAFGVILYILLGGYPPFHHEKQEMLFKKIVKADYQFHPEYWGAVSDDAKDLIRGLLTLDMNKRLDVDQALSHRWVGAADEVLAARNLDSNLAELKKFQARRKLRAGVKAVMAVNRMKNILGGGGGGGLSASNSAEEQEVADNRI